MVIGQRGRGVSTAALGRLARTLVRWNISPDVVTIAGTAATALVSFGVLARGHLVAGSLLLGVVLLTDSIDGLMARQLRRSSAWGAFLDSTMDRIGDASVFSAITIVSLTLPGTLGRWTAGFALAIVPLALLVSYTRARAEGLGLTASGGLAERTDRLVVALVGCLLVGLGLPTWVLTAALGWVAIASLITVGQRIAAVYRQVHDYGA